MRSARDAHEYLLVRPSNGNDEWVLPKGHVEKGETTETTAVREVREEAGVVAAIEAPLGSFEQPAKSGLALVAWYLMRFESAVRSDEERAVGWFAFEEAVSKLSFETARDLLRAAAARLAGANTPG